MTPTLSAMVRKPVPGAAMPASAELAARLRVLAEKVEAGGQVVTTISTAELRLVIAKLEAPVAKHVVEHHEAVRLKPPAGMPPRVRVKAGRARS